jgi:hypothetical protein
MHHHGTSVNHPAAKLKACTSSSFERSVETTDRAKHLRLDQKCRQCEAPRHRINRCIRI